MGPMGDEQENRESVRPEHEEMSSSAMATRSLRTAIVAIPLGIVLLLISPGLGYDLRDAATVAGGISVIVGVFALLRGLWYKVG